MNWKEQIKQNENIRCVNCQYDIKNSVSGGMYPRPDTPPETIHRWENRQCYNYSVLCPRCAHYMVAEHIRK